MKEGIAKDLAWCAICGSRDSEHVATGREHEYTTTTSDEFSFVRCTNCGLVYLNPRPAESEISTIYPSDYYAYQLVERRAASRSSSTTILSRYMKSRATSRLRHYVNMVRLSGPPPYRILDIGCGDGSTLDLWQEAFDGQADTYGVEMDPRAASIAAERGHDITTSRIEDASFEAQSFDIVYASHVIEHVPNPADFLSIVGRILSPRGIVVLDTPNFDTIDRRIFGKRHWGAYHFPRHFFIFDEETFSALAKKSSFEIVETRYFPSAVMWVWTLHSILCTYSRSLADLLFHPVRVYLSGSPWNVGLLCTFTAFDLGIIATTGRSSNMRLLLRRKTSARPE